MDVSDSTGSGFRPPLAERVAIVTGAGQGIGEAVARRLGAAGATVVVAARRSATGEPVAESIRADGFSAHCIEADVTDRASVVACVAETVERFGGLHIVVHNAFAGGVTHRLDDDDLLDHWDQMSRTAAWGSVICAQAAAPHLVAAGRWGRLIFISSPAGVDGSAAMPMYSAVKGAQRAMAKSLAREWGAYGITANCIAPVAASPALVHHFETRPELRAGIEARSPLRRVGDPVADIGGVVAFLASDDAAYITGQTIMCDGGATMPC